MSLTITLPPHSERQLRADAVLAGLSPEELAARRLEEAPLLERITHWIEPGVWHRYRELMARSDASRLSEEERAEFLRLNDEVEIRHAERLERIAEVARLRGLPVQEALTELGIQFPIP